MLKEFKPALFFLGKFLGIYLTGNIVYGIHIESFGGGPDTATYWVTRQTSWLLNLGNDHVRTELSPHRPTVHLLSGHDVVLNVFEGCNGINVMIVYVAFMGAFGGPVRKLVWFVPAGLLLIHVFNLLRIVMLYFVQQHWESWFYYVHKYVFTAVLYAVVFILWAVWIRLIVQRSRHAAHANA